jgi:hypothetical protein
MKNIENKKIFEQTSNGNKCNAPRLFFFAHCFLSVFLRRFVEPHGFNVADFFSQYTLHADFERHIRRYARRTRAAQPYKHNAVLYAAERYFTAVALNKRAYLFVHYHSNALVKSFVGQILRNHN